MKSIIRKNELQTNRFYAGVRVLWLISHLATAVVLENNTDFNLFSGISLSGPFEYILLGVLWLMGGTYFCVNAVHFNQEYDAEFYLPDIPSWVSLCFMGIGVIYMAAQCIYIGAYINEGITAFSLIMHFVLLVTIVLILYREISYYRRIAVTHRA